MSEIRFSSKEHEKFFYQMLAKCGKHDSYYSSFFYCVGISEDTRNHVDRMFDFKERLIKPEALHEGWQTGGSARLTRLAFNLWNGYLEWAKARGGYTLANAAEFSDMMAQRMGWSSYGDKQYVPHVLQYYAFGRIPTGIGNQAIVQVAASQEGKGGTTYWSWYGFGSRVEWCACFVSWCADQSGYIQSGVIPKFSLCSDGVRWFESKGRFRDKSYIPAAGDIIFFDWGNNGTIDHVGIVESVSGGTVNTIEGNSGDKVARRSYSIGSSNIYGYGVPAY